jgi:hypothetical protein
MDEAVSFDIVLGDEPAAGLERCWKMIGRCADWFGPWASI